MSDWSEPGIDASCWIVSDGNPGAENQCLGLAEALDLDPQVIRVSHPPVLRLLPPHLLPAGLWLRLAQTGPSSRKEVPAFRPPWPDILISCSRKAVGFSIAVRRLSGKKTFTAHIQAPQVPVRCFDLVAPPAHDGLKGENVVETIGALNRVTPRQLAEAAKIWGPGHAHLPRPLVAVLIGGATRRHRLDPQDAEHIADQIFALAERENAGVIVTPSRRTPTAVAEVLQRRFCKPRAHCWDGTGPNPYFGFLALADMIAVSGDSVSMISEACTTGKPVYMIELSGGSGRFHRFYERLRRDDRIRPLGERLETWYYPPLDDTERVAQAVRDRIFASPAVSK